MKDFQGCRRLVGVVFALGLWCSGLPTSARESDNPTGDEATEIQRELEAAAREAREGIDRAAREAEEQLSVTVTAAERRANWGWLGLLGLLGLLKPVPKRR